MLCKLILGLLDCLETNFDNAPWNDFALVTPRHAVQRCWNEEALEKHCQESRSRLFICRAEDMIKKKRLTLAEQYGLALRGHGSKGRKRKDLPDSVEFAVGSKVLIMQNIETDLDVTNGACGTIVDVILDPQEPLLDLTEEKVDLEYLPIFVLVRMNRTQVEGLSGLEENIIPIQPVGQSMRIQVRTRGGKWMNCTIMR